MFLNHVEKKKLLGQTEHFFKNLLRFTPLRNGCLITFKKMQKPPSEVFYKEAQENTCVWSLFLILNIVKFLRTPNLKNICKHLLLKMCS